MRGIQWIPFTGGQYWFRALMFYVIIRNNLLNKHSFSRRLETPWCPCYIIVTWGLQWHCVYCNWCQCINFRKHIDFPLGGSYWLYEWNIYWDVDIIHLYYVNHMACWLCNSWNTQISRIHHILWEHKLFGFKEWISNCTHRIPCGVITHSCHNFSVALVWSPFKW